ncbi:Phage antitermination protein Q [Vibrio aerogenes CECT 7868]|uniref:Phage antitermination protein Q n=1 Tax=Vibrio aerogenes CECT 7868 TaxID=1216006 RepID=A0A1M6C2L7_9VIBR|nr:antiterminator Q family protein [Vibrio aerogenes]SHI55004.1 Phage antitermination protein Q [Vibrio aerogenes CECT 7868]
MTNTIIHTTDWLIEQWVCWIRHNREGVAGYASCSPFTRLLGNGLPSPMISEEDAMLVDRAIARLNQRDPQMAKALTLYFFAGGNISYVARQMNFDRRQATILVKSGTAWIDAVIDLSKTGNKSES